MELNNFCTGSSFQGEFDEEGKMTGFGIYRYPDGTEYRGHFRNGVFHGRGMLIHPNKFKLCGYFVNGVCDDYQLYFGDGLEYSQGNWTYCTPRDRRFWVEIVRGISPVGETFLTKDKPSRLVPLGMYDIGEGFYDPKVDYILNAKTGERIRFVCPDEKVRIMQMNRMNPIDFENAMRKEAESRVKSISTDSLVSDDE